jgi:hypothetical protein
MKWLRKLFCRHQFARFKRAVQTATGDIDVLECQKCQKVIYDFPKVSCETISKSTRKTTRKQNRGEKNA